MKMLKKAKSSEHWKRSQSERPGKEKAVNFSLDINITLQWFKVIPIQCNWFHVIYNKKVNLQIVKQMMIEKEVFGSSNSFAHEIRSVKLILLNKFW